MRLFYSTLFSLIMVSLMAQSPKYWKPNNGSVLLLETAANAKVLPEKRRIIDMDFDHLSSYLELMAPDEFSGHQGLALELPLPDGTSEIFYLYYSPVYEPAFNIKFPDIRTYRGYSKENTEHNLRMTLSPLGVKAAIYTPKGQIYIDPIVEGKTRTHAVYYVNDYPTEVLQDFDHGCGVTHADESPIAGMDFSKVKSKNQLRGTTGEGVSLKVFRAAIATTGEWTLVEGGIMTATAKLVSAVDRFNLVYENEVAIRIVLVANNNLVVFQDPDVDPYIGNEPKSGRDLISINTMVLNNFIGAGNYDIGHVFTRRCSDVGGVASLASVCGGNKGSGTTCWYNRDIDYTVVRIMCHEMGHQFSATHTMNHCDQENETLATGFEPGSGSTIMSYGGLCGIQNVVSGSEAARDITYFHANSLQRIYNFSRSLNCGTEITTANSKPDAKMDYKDGFTIPVRTPFVLNGEGTDMENDNLTFCFEQHDAASVNCDLGSPTGSCPAFRSFPPHDENYRIFPSFGLIWNNQTFASKNEVLVDYTREFNFVLTVRDNNEEAGAWGMDTMTFFTDENSGPFRVSYPNNGEDQLAGDIIEITWDVANTHQLPVNCRAVDIALLHSSNWGDTTIIKAATENDGSEWVKLPTNVESGVRILIIASDNIFFDISDRSFDIVEPASPGYSWGVSPNYQRICLPDVFRTEITTTGYLGFQGNIAFDIVSGLPVGATYSFDQGTVDINDGTSLTVDLTGVMGKQNVILMLRGITDGNDTLFRTIDLELISNDYTDLLLTNPADGEQGLGQNPTFTWDVADDADYYNFQLATDPSFSPASLIQENLNITNNSVTLNNILIKNTLYFWRVQGGNVCGLGAYTLPAAFSTEAASCKSYESQDIDVRVPSNGLSEFNLTIDVDATINDLNICNFDFYCSYLSDATIYLTSPSSTKVLVAEQECGNTTEYKCKFDDAGRSLRCPPADERSYRPKESFSIFNGETARGKWVLGLDLTRFAQGAELGGWCLEVCVNQTLDAPYLVINDTLKMKPGEHSPIRTTNLQTKDDNDADDNLHYALLSLPTKGEVTLNGVALGMGATFTQADINNQRVKYNHTSGVNGDRDQFVFIVRDESGGWTGSHVFYVHADESFPSGANDLKFEELFTLYPNPSEGATEVFFTQSVEEDIEVSVHNLQGQLLQTHDVKRGAKSLTLDLGTNPNGVYLVKTQMGHTIYIQKVTLQK